MSKLSSLYSQCATQGKSCPTSKIDEAIAFADPTRSGPIHYTNFKANSTTGFSCTNSAFGNPSGTTDYACYSGNIPADVRAGGTSFFDNGVPKGWAKCADQGGICNPNVSAPVDILFGTDGSYVYANAESVPCDTTVFTDPAPGKTKACYWRSPLIPINPTPSTPINPTPSTSHRNKWLIYGLAIGIPILLIIIILVIWFIARSQ